MVSNVAFARRRLAVLACALIIGAPWAIGEGRGATDDAGGAGFAASGRCAGQPSADGQSARHNTFGAARRDAARFPDAARHAGEPSADGQSARPRRLRRRPPRRRRFPRRRPPARPRRRYARRCGGLSDDTSTGLQLEMTSHPAAFMEGKANWTDGFAALTGAFGQVRAALDKSGVKASGRPIAVFTETDDSGFTYRAMIPIDKAPEGKTTLTDAIKLGQTPAGKAMKFEHRGSYEDIDATYEAITAYLDEKGLEAANLFVEEYLNEVKTADDPNLQVDIYVLLK